MTTPDATTATARAVRSLDLPSAYALSSAVPDVSSPDSPESAGAAWLVSLAEDVRERLTYADPDDVTAYATGSEAARERLARELADLPLVVPPPYTTDLWAVFTDLALWAVEWQPHATAEQRDDLTALARLAVTLTADATVAACLDLFREPLALALGLADPDATPSA